MNIPVKLLHPDAKLPVFSTDGAAGADVFARLDAPVYLHPGENKLVPLGFSIALHPGTAAFLLPRSGLGHKNGIVLGNLIGLVDEDYRGEVMASLWNRNHEGAAFRVNHGDRIAQMVIQRVEQPAFYAVDDLDATERGDGGFGSTGIQTNQGK